VVRGILAELDAMSGEGSEPVPLLRASALELIRQAGDVARSVVDYRLVQETSEVNLQEIDRVRTVAVDALRRLRFHAFRLHCELLGVDSAPRSDGAP
jgi:hypothetical protein